MSYDFPNSPTLNQVFGNYTWDGQKWKQTAIGILPSNTPPPMDGVATAGSSMLYARGDHVHPGDTNSVRTDIAQGFTANQQAQARGNISALKKNYVLNGAMMVSQENGTAGGGNTQWYPADMFYTITSGTTGTWASQQVAGTSPAGSPNRMRITVTAADAAVAAGDIAWIVHAIEGVRYADLRWGGANAKTITLQFGVKAPAGTYSISFGNNAANRTYVAEYVIAAGEANTDVVKSVTVAGDVTGTWATDNTKGVEIRFALMCGSSWQQAAGSWAAANPIGSPNQFNFMGTNGNVFELFDVGLYEGNVAPPFMVPDYASELALCQRYFRMWGAGAKGIWSSATLCRLTEQLPVAMRAAPTATLTTTTPTIEVWWSAAVVGSGTVISNNWNTPTCVDVALSGFGSGGGVYGNFSYSGSNIVKASARL